MAHPSGTMRTLTLMHNTADHYCPHSVDAIPVSPHSVYVIPISPYSVDAIAVSPHSVYTY